MVRLQQIFARKYRERKVFIRESHKRRLRYFRQCDESNCTPYDLLVLNCVLYGDVCDWLWQ